MPPARLQSPSLDLFSSIDHLLCSPEIDIGWRQVVQRLMVAGVVVVLHEVCDSSLQVGWGVVVLQPDDVLHRTVPALDLALSHRVIRRTAHMIHLLALEKPCQVPGEIGGAVVREQPRPVAYPGSIKTGLFKRQLQGLFNVLRAHGAGQPPGYDVAGVIVEDRRQVVPAPVVEDLELGEVGLPELVYPPGGLFELVPSRHHLEDRALDQVEALQDAIHARF